MDETALAPVGIDHTTLASLETYEDFLTFYLQLEEASTAFNWLKADTLYQMSQKLGDKSLEQLAKDLQQPESTVTNYIRVVKAFPTDKREPILSFSTHFQASFADSFNDKNQEFEGEKRFEWIKKAAEEGLSTRKLKNLIQSEKQALIASENGIEAARRVEAVDKVTQIKKLLDDLLNAVKRGDDQDAFAKIVDIHTKIYG